MPDNINVNVALDEPAVAANLDQLRYLVFEGKKGGQGETGSAGEDGFSPTVAVTDITGGHRVTITDEDGAHTFDVMDGEDGEDAELPALTSADNGKVLIADEGEWVKGFLLVDHPVKVATYGATTAAEIIGWVQNGKTVFMWYDNRMYYYVFHQMGSAYFLSEYGNKFYYAYVTVDTWNTGVVEIAPKNSPTFTGEPKAPTPSAGDNSTKIATTAYVQGELAGVGGSGDVATIDLEWDSDDIYSASYNGAAITGGDIADLLADGKTVLGRADDIGVYVCQIVETDNAPGVKFILPGSYGINVILIRNDSSAGNASFTPYPNPLPSVSSSDSGKVLTVNSSGQWAAQTAPVTSVNGQTGTVVIPLAQPGETHVNVLNPADAVQGYIAAQGQINNSDTYWSTGYIAVSEGDVLRVFYDGANKNHAYAAEYSTAAQSGFISRTDNGSYASYTVQHDGYVRLSVKTSAVAWANVSSAMVTINDTDSTYIAYGDLGANDGLMSAADKKKLDGLGRSAGKKVFDKFLFIAYSSFGNNAPNSVPHYEDCAKKDYDWLKADVQPTSDGGLVCCHDSGFTLDGNGRITTYNSSSATEIYTMTLAQATALTYASYPTTHVASIDDFLEVCKRYGKTPQITIRDAHMDVVVPALMSALDRFALRSVAVINSSTRASLDAVRTADKDITMSLFMNPFGSSMASGYNYCLADGNTMLGYFYTQSSHTWAEFIASSTIAGYIEDCIENGIVMWAGIESDASHVDDLIAMGFSGIHTMQDRPLPIPTKTSDLTNDSGFQTAAQVQSAIAAAAELPAVTSTDNGKFLRVVNGAWAAETVQTWQGGSY